MFLPLFILICSNIFVAVHPEKDAMLLTRQKTAFHIRQSSFSNLLKAKATNALELVPKSECIVFRQCSLGANDESELAQCFVGLFRERDKHLASNREKHPADQGQEESILGRFFRTTLNSLVPFLNLEKFYSKTTKNIEEDLRQNNEVKNRQKIEQIQIKWQAMIRRKNGTETANLTRKNNVNKMRRKRSLNLKKHSTDEQLPISLDNLEKLQRIGQFFRRFNEFRRSIERYNGHRSRLLQSFPQLFNAQNIKNVPHKITENSMEDPGNISLFSPKLFSLFPPQNSGAKEGRHKIVREIFSPDVLSFYEEEEGGRGTDQGRIKNANLLESGRIASIPQLLRLITSNRQKQNKWLDFLIQITGAAPVLNRLYQQIQQFELTLQKRVLPLAMDLERMANGLVQLERTLGTKQKDYFKEKGYTFLNSRQMKLMEIGRDKSGRMARLNRRTRRATAMDDQQFEVVAQLMEDHIEDYIKEVASAGNNPDHGQIVRRIRRKRQLPISGPVVGILAPFAFVPQLNSLQLFTLYVLSPQAFIPSYNNPAMFYVQLLTPWAFLANLFSPQAFTCLCLSPVFFEANALSPQFFYLELLSPTMVQANLLSPYFFLATILSPQIMIADLLTPNFFQYKIFSPQHFLASLLGPNIGSPSIFSEQSHLFNVLSPQIASPNIYSKISDSVFIFSPEILGGHGGERGYEEEGENVITIPDEDHPIPGAGKFGIVHTHG